MFFAKKRKKYVFKIIAIVAIFSVITAGLVYKFSSLSEKSPISDFIYSRDSQDILKVFDKNWYWLVASTRQEYSPDFMMKNRTPDKDPSNFGSLIIKVLRDNNKFAGFTAYFKKKLYEGFLLYVAVDNDFRGKGYGEMLTNYAVNDLFASGCNIVKLVTRTENVKARALYKKVGFEETLVEDGYVYCTKYKK